jgi:hypothetical protein
VGSGFGCVNVVLGSNLISTSHGRQQRSITLGSTAAVPETENTFAAVARQFVEAKRKEWRPKTSSAVTRHLFDYAAGLHGRPSPQSRSVTLRFCSIRLRPRLGT